MSNWKRFVSAICVALALIFGAGFALQANEGIIRVSQPAGNSLMTPVLGALIDASERELQLEIRGAPGTTAHLLLLAEPISGPPTVLPVTLDAQGSWSGTYDLTMLLSQSGLHMRMAVLGDPGSGTPVLSNELALRMSKVAASPSTPSGSTSGSALWTLPGDPQVQVPVSWAWIALPGAGVGDFAFFSVAPDGAEGVIPVH